MTFKITLFICGDCYRNCLSFKQEKVELKWDGKYFCWKCPKVYSTMKGLDSHIKAKH